MKPEDPTLHAVSFDVIKLWRWLFKKDTWKNWVAGRKRYARALRKPREEETTICKSDTDWQAFQDKGKNGHS